ncbi:fibrinogen-like YCDxxxxGGGW domain-containing protein [Haliangium sp.]|uniref:fibrinogen-like YCDxxxxGGGW domain-containing protein n=1 Tax=Haliangium sp. TaxID=2663208 RepID=UPI003D0E5C5A
MFKTASLAPLGWRLVLGLIGAVALGACSGSDGPDDVPCSEDDPCPTGQLCSADGVCRPAPPPDAAAPLIDAAPGSSIDAAPGSGIDAATPLIDAGPGPDAEPSPDAAPVCDLCDPDATCAEVGDGYECVCNPGFFGDGTTSCVPTGSCAEILAMDPSALSGLYAIDPDGDGVGAPAFEVQCDMLREGGGWTLVLVSSDDGTDTWTMAARTRMTTDTAPIGDVHVLDRDFKSPAYHALAFRDLLFVHVPSGVTAEYEGVGDGSGDVGSFLGALPYPVCDLTLAGNGHALTGGSLTATGQLCDTDLYFNLGDHESGEAVCQDPRAGANTASFGPVWNMGNNNGCPFDDPGLASLGPQDQCAQCGPGTDTTEHEGVGFGTPLNLNTGDPGSGENRMLMFAR